MPVADLVLEECKWVTDRSGLPIDISGAVWRLNDITGREKVDWGAFPLIRDNVFATIRGFIVHMIETQSALSAKNAFDALLNIAKLGILPNAGTVSGIVLDAASFLEIRQSFGNRAYRLHYLRRWYCWGADQGFPCFCPDAAFEIDRTRVGGNAKGHAVLSQDPTEGPLSDLEVSALLNALKDPVRSTDLTLSERAAVWLCVALGPNPIQPASMREEDVVEVPGGDDQGAFVHLQIPRMEKGPCRKA